MKILDENGLLYLWGRIKDWVKSYVAEHSGGTADSVAWDDITGKPDVALKSDLTTVYRYKGSVENFASLPTVDNEVGDVWNVEDTNMNYGWTGSDWDPLGQIFEVEALTNAEIDAIMSA